MEGRPLSLNAHKMAGLKAQNDPWIPLSENNGIISPPPCDPRHQLIDSDRYIESLEKKLKRLKGRNKPEPSSRDIIDSLAGFKDDQMRRFLSNGHAITSESSSMIIEDVATSPSSGSYLQRRLHPQRQALNMEELFELLKDDELARNRQQDEEEEEEVVPVSQAEGSELSAKDVSNSCDGGDSRQTDSSKLEEKRELQDLPENDRDEQRVEVKRGSHQGEGDASQQGDDITSGKDEKVVCDQTEQDI